MTTQTSEVRAKHERLPSTRHKLFLGLIVLAWAGIYLGSLFQPTLLDDADSVHAEAAREMATVDHDWVTLHINNGFRYLEKAPLMYWAVAGSFKLFGVHDWSARLPIALGVLALLLVTYRLGRRVFGEEAGFYSALTLATGFGPFIFTRILIPDMAVALWLAIGFYFFWTTLEQVGRGEQASRLACWGFAATVALNLLTKGLIGVVFPAATMIVFLLLARNLRHLLRMRPISSLLVFLAVAVPWHVLAGIRNPAQGRARGFFWFYFVNEHFLRYLNKRFPADYDTVPLWLFWGLNLLWLIPWTAFLPQALRLVPWRATFPKTSATPESKETASQAITTTQEKGALLFALWILVVLVFFSFSSRQEYYAIAGIPGLALLLGGWLAREADSPIASSERGAGRISSAALMAVGVASLAATLLLAAPSTRPPANYDIADLLKKNPQDYALSFGHFLDLTPQAMGAFRIPLLVTGAALATGTVLNWMLRRRDRTFAANIALGIMMVVVLRAAHSGLVTFSPVLSSEKLAEVIESNWIANAVIETNGDYETASSVNFYTRRQIRMLNGRCNNIWYGSEFPDAPANFDDDISFQKLWQSGQPVFLLTQEDASAAPKAAGIEKCPQDQRLPLFMGMEQACQLAKWGGKLLLTNEPRLCPAPARARR